MSSIISIIQSIINTIKIRFYDFISLFTFNNIKLYISRYALHGVILILALIIGVSTIEYWGARFYPLAKILMAIFNFLERLPFVLFERILSLSIKILNTNGFLASIIIIIISRYPILATLNSAKCFNSDLPGRKYKEKNMDDYNDILYYFKLSYILLLIAGFLINFALTTTEIEFGGVVSALDDAKEYAKTKIQDKIIQQASNNMFK